MGEELTKKKRIRAGHRASVTRIIAQVQQALESEELNSSKLKQQLQTLREKVDVLRKLDSDILSALETEEDITGMGVRSLRERGGRNFIQGDLTSPGLRDSADSTSGGGGGVGGAVRVK